MREQVNGFTLLELLIAISIGALLLGLGIPAMSSMLSDNTQAFQSQQLVKQLRFARSQAIDNRALVTACLIDSAGKCDKNGDRLVVFLDADNDSILDTGETIVAEMAAFPSTLTVSSNRVRYRFSPEGTSIGFNGTFEVCIQGQTKTTVVVAASGRASTNSTTEACS